MLGFLRGMFRNPHTPSAPFHYKAGPTYNVDPALQSIWTSDLALPRKEVWGSGTPVRGQLGALSGGSLLLARKAIPTVGINQATGQYAIQPTTQYGGTFIQVPDTGDAAELGAILGE